MFIKKKRTHGLIRIPFESQIYIKLIIFGYAFQMFLMKRITVHETNEEQSRYVGTLNIHMPLNLR